MTVPGTGVRSMFTDEVDKQQRERDYDSYHGWNPLTEGTVGADDGYHYYHPDHEIEDDSPHHHQQERHRDYHHDHDHYGHHQQPPHDHVQDDRPYMFGNGSIPGSCETGKRQ